MVFVKKVMILIFELFWVLVYLTPDAMKVYIDGEFVQVLDDVQIKHEMNLLSLSSKKHGIEYFDKTGKNGSYLIYENSYDDRGRLSEKHSYYVLNPMTSREIRGEYTSYYEYDGYRILSKRTEFKDYTQEIKYVY